MNVEHRRGHNDAGLETEHRGAAALREGRKLIPDAWIEQAQPGQQAEDEPQS